MYALTVAKGGLKIAPMGPDDCTPLELNISGPPPIGLEEEIARVSRGGKPFCGHGIMGGRNGSAEALILNGQTMDGVASALSRLLDRHVLNKTGVDGKFLLYLEYAPDEHTPRLATEAATSPADVSGPNIFGALEKLGLTIEPARGPKGFIVIDRAERPSIDGR
jgi:uncharacterized protein (TIGR03435 family)